MKTKLLKKVRKRYEISKVTKVSSSTEMWNRFLKDCEKDFGLPFYVVSDNEDSWRTRVYKDYDTAYTTLKKFIRSDYEYVIKKDQTKQEKLWYKN